MVQCGMALFGTLEIVTAQCARLAEFRAALEYAREAVTPGAPAHARLAAMAEGTTHRVELAEGAYAVEMAYRTKARPDGFFETHRRFIDLQVVVAGEELMEVAPAASLGVAQPYDEAREFTKHVDTREASVLRVGAGSAAVFWPADAHMPSLAVHEPALVRKTVVKVPVPA